MYAKIPVWYISILLPVLVGVLGLILGERKGSLIAKLSAISLIIPTLALGHYWANVNIAEGIVDPIVIDLTKYKLGTFALVLDGLSAPIVLGISLVTAFVAIYGYKYMTVRIEEMHSEGEKVPSIGVYYFLYNVFAVSMLGMALANNLIFFYFFLEVSLISSFLLIAYYGYGDRRKISLLYFIWTHVAGALFIAGVLYYGVKAGSFDILTISNTGVISYIAPASTTIGSAYKIAAAAIIVGLFIKMAVFGVHMWLPYAHAEAPTPVSALLSPNLIGIAGYAFIRFAFPLFPEVIYKIHYYLLGLAIITIIYGGLVALRQTDFKRFLAYSSVSQMGYLLLGIATLSAYGIGGAILHYFTHAIGKAVLFMVAGVFITELHGLRNITKMGGLARAYPLMAAAALLGFMHLVGMPPTIGMWSELLITIGVVKAIPLTTVDNVILVAAILILSFGISAAYAFITMRKIFYGQLKEQVPQEVMDGFKYAVIVLAVLGVVFFLIVAPLMSPLQQASELVASLIG